MHAAGPATQPSAFEAAAAAVATAVQSGDGAAALPAPPPLLAAMERSQSHLQAQLLGQLEAQEEACLRQGAVGDAAAAGKGLIASPSRELLRTPCITGRHYLVELTFRHLFPGDVHAVIPVRNFKAVNELLRQWNRELLAFMQQKALHQLRKERRRLKQQREQREQQQQQQDGEQQRQRQQQQAGGSGTELQEVRVDIGGLQGGGAGAGSRPAPQPGTAGSCTTPAAAEGAAALVPPAQQGQVSATSSHAGNLRHRSEQSDPGAATRARVITADADEDMSRCQRCCASLCMRLGCCMACCGGGGLQDGGGRGSMAALELQQQLDADAADGGSSSDGGGGGCCGVRQRTKRGSSVWRQRPQRDGGNAAGGSADGAASLEAHAKLLQKHWAKIQQLEADIRLEQAKVGRASRVCATGCCSSAARSSSTPAHTTMQQNTLATLSATPHRATAHRTPPHTRAHTHTHTHAHTHTHTHTHTRRRHDTTRRRWPAQTPAPSLSCSRRPRPPRSRPAAPCSRRARAAWRPSRCSPRPALRTSRGR
jgi:hypothetical protein